ncbi:MAG: hypothetical protein FWE37_02580 [Spirochaetaceae bacterium]|nr:hypothetical protein [Spirochaetaceae bacterium]
MSTTTFRELPDITSPIGISFVNTGTLTGVDSKITYNNLVATIRADLGIQDILNKLDEAVTIKEGLDGRISTLETQLAVAKQDIAGLKNRVEVLENRPLYTIPIGFVIGVPSGRLTPSSMGFPSSYVWANITSTVPNIIAGGSVWIRTA